MIKFAYSTDIHMTTIPIPQLRVPWIFFDLDDTIWNFSQNSTLSLAKLYEISPILRKLFRAPREFIEIYHVHNANLWNLYSKGEVSTKQLKVERWRKTLATRQFEVLTAVCEELDTTYLDILAKSTLPVEGAHDLLSQLQKRAMIAVISNGFSDTQYKKITYSGLWKFITRVVVSEELGINKPNRAIFDYALAETGATGSHLYVGDHPETDILGAMKAGWHTIWINHKAENFPLTDAELIRQGIDPALMLAEVSSLKQAYPAINSYLNSLR